jgi:hypothetical protein
MLSIAKRTVAKLLFDGSDRAIALQPLSVEVQRAASCVATERKRSSAMISITGDVPLSLSDAALGLPGVRTRSQEPNSMPGAGEVKPQEECSESGRIRDWTTNCGWTYFQISMPTLARRICSSSSAVSLVSESRMRTRFSAPVNLNGTL